MKKLSLLLVFIQLFFAPGIISSGSLPPAPKNGSVKKEIYGVASYYHNKFNGRKTSSGEIFRNDSLTAAHKSLPLGTWVKITNLKNDSIVIVKVNDRLPKWSKRTIDLTTAAAKQLNFIRAGLAKVRIEVLERPSELITDSLKVSVTQ